MNPRRPRRARLPNGGERHASGYYMTTERTAAPPQPPRPRVSRDGIVLGSLMSRENLPSCEGMVLKKHHLVKIAVNVLKFLLD